MLLMEKPIGKPWEMVIYMENHYASNGQIHYFYGLFQ